MRWENISSHIFFSIYIIRWDYLFLIRRRRILSEINTWSVYCWRSLLIKCWFEILCWATLLHCHVFYCFALIYSLLLISCLYFPALIWPTYFALPFPAVRYGGNISNINYFSKYLNLFTDFFIPSHSQILLKIKLLRWMPNFHAINWCSQLLKEI